jgi:hypothetical protein
MLGYMYDTRHMSERGLITEGRKRVICSRDYDHEQCIGTLKLSVYNVAMKLIFDTELQPNIHFYNSRIVLIGSRISIVTGTKTTMKENTKGNMTKLSIQEMSGTARETEFKVCITRPR